MHRQLIASLESHLRTAAYTTRTEEELRSHGRRVGEIDVRAWQGSVYLLFEVKTGSTPEKASRQLRKALQHIPLEKAVPAVHAFYVTGTPSALSTQYLFSFPDTAASRLQGRNLAEQFSYGAHP